MAAIDQTNISTLGMVSIPQGISSRNGVFGSTVHYNISLSLPQVSSQTPPHDCKTQKLHMLWCTKKSDLLEQNFKFPAFKQKSFKDVNM